MVVISSGFVDMASKSIIGKLAEKLSCGWLLSTVGFICIYDPGWFFSPTRLGWQRAIS